MLLLYDVESQDLTIFSNCKLQHSYFVTACELQSDGFTYCICITFLTQDNVLHYLNNSKSTPWGLCLAGQHKMRTSLIDTYINFINFNLSDDIDCSTQMILN